MGTQHTPGPWELRGDSSGPLDRVYGGDGFEICELSGADQANGRLIAAAPDLFQALDELMAELDARNEELLNAAGIQCGFYRDTGGMVLARMALAKAQGRKE